MKDYIKYIAQNESSYRRTLYFLVLIFTVIMFILISITVRKKTLYQVEGNVDLIKSTRVSRKSNNTFDLKQQYHLEDVIDIRIAGISYYVESNFRSRWDEVLDKISVRDHILIQYINTQEGNSICQLEKNSTILLNYKELLKTKFYIQIGLLIVSILLLSYIFTLFFLRKSYLQKKR